MIFTSLWSHLDSFQLHPLIKLLQSESSTLTRGMSWLKWNSTLQAKQCCVYVCVQYTHGWAALNSLIHTFQSDLYITTTPPSILYMYLLPSLLDLALKCRYVIITFPCKDIKKCAIIAVQSDKFLETFIKLLLLWICVRNSFILAE